MTRKKKNWIQRVFSPTPKEWKKIRNQYGSLALALAGGLTAVQTSGIEFPQSVKIGVGVVIGLATTISLYAQSHELK